MKKHALITGASSGIGYQLAKQLAQKGYVVFGVAPTNELSLIDPLTKEFGVIAIAGDITLVLDIKRIAKEVEDQAGKLDILYNNAGIAVGGPAIEFDDDDLYKVFNVNVLGHILMTKYLAGYVIKAKGTIVFTASVAARVPLTWTSLYCSTKAAIDLYALSLHLEMQPFGVRVHSVITGGVQTAIADKVDTSKLSLESRFNVTGVEDSIKEAQNMSRNPAQSIPAELYAQQVLAKVTASRDVGLHIYAGGKAYTLHLLGRYAPTSLLERGISRHFKSDRVWAEIRKKSFN